MSNIHIMNRLWWNFMEWSEVVKGTHDQILIAIQMTMLTVQSEVQPLLSKFWGNCADISRIALQLYKVKMSMFFGWSASPCWLSKEENKQYGGNEVHWPVRSALSAYSYFNALMMHIDVLILEHIFCQLHSISALIYKHCNILNWFYWQLDYIKGDLWNVFAPCPQ